MSSLHNRQSVEEMAYVHICLEVNQISQVRPRNSKLEIASNLLPRKGCLMETAKLTMLSSSKKDEVKNSGF